MPDLGEVRIAKHGPAATIHYAEPGGSYDFAAELGTGPTLLYVYAPSDDGEWARRLPWAAGRRTQILEHVGRQIVRSEARGSKFVVHAGGVDILTPRW